MSKIQVVTTFSPAGYTCYGRRFLDTLLPFTDIDVAVYHESMQSEVKPNIRISWRNLDDDEDRQRFLSAHGSDPEKVGSNADFNSQSIRFCHKVFALTDAARKTDADWLVWMDADVVVHASPNWAECLPDSASLVYLGREAVSEQGWTVNKVWRPICTETGFVGYRLTDSVTALLKDMRKVYTSGELYTWPKTDWHDAKVFDVCRERSAVPRDLWHSLSAGVKGTDVWAHTALGKWSLHHKVPRRKVKVYGGVVP
jgi:hypothetical protein